MSQRTHWVIDMQGAQTASRLRGIGRFSESLARVLIAQAEGRRITLLFNAAFPGTISRWRETIATEGWPIAVRTWQPPGDVRLSEPANHARARLAEALYGAVIEDLAPDGLLVTSLFEGFGDDAAISLAAVPDRVPVAVVQYDLIPWLHQADYLEPDPEFARYYRYRLRDLQRARCFLAISESSANELADSLDIDPDHVAVIGADTDPHFQEKAIPATLPPHLRHRGLAEGFILYVGGIDPRKNLDSLLRGVAMLPPDLRRRHPLVVVAKLDATAADWLRERAAAIGVPRSALWLLDDIEDDDLLALYGHCGVFVFPSRHEGFGLPVLEAMRCGAPVLAANTTSLPEVVGNPEALFDPDDPARLSRLIERVLGKPGFRESLVARGLDNARRFSWSVTGSRTWQALDGMVAESRSFQRESPRQKPRLALVSPLPPARTGIADYVVELLDPLADHFELVLVTDQQEIDEGIQRRFGPVRDREWLRRHPREFDRVLYQVGNSPFHAEADDLLDDIPGVVVLHDFYLGGLFLHRPPGEAPAHPWYAAAFASHGYAPLVEAESGSDSDLVDHWPTNWPIIERALGVIVHSRHAAALADTWYGEDAGSEWPVIPHLRRLPEPGDKREARAALGIPGDTFLVCCFGLVAPPKRNLELLEAWLETRAFKERAGRLVLVGENHGGDYGRQVNRLVAQARGSVKITGWASREQFQAYLRAADLAVQLRGESRGETSGTVLDAMAHGLPVIVNAHGSMAELPDHAVEKCPDTVSVDQLTGAIDRLHADPEARGELGRAARDWIASHHDPDHCGQRYAEAIESAYQRAQRGLEPLVDRIVADPAFQAMPEPDRVAVARALDASFPAGKPRPRFLLDVTGTAGTDRHTGIERVAHALTRQYLEHPPHGYRVQPVQLVHEEGGWVYRAAHGFAARTLGIASPPLEEAVIEPAAGDVLLVADLAGAAFLQAAEQGVFESARARGARVAAIVYDLLPVTHPECFPPGSDDGHHAWLAQVLRFDTAIAISRSVADQLRGYAHDHGPRRPCPLHIDWFHLGADIKEAAPSQGIPARLRAVLDRLRERPGFLMVGTIEPRKRHAEVLEAFERLWAQGSDIDLVIAGAEGWQGLDDAQRRDIPATIARLRSHPEQGHRLHWFGGLSDEALDQLYATADWLIAASVDEGFGLPLVEAAHRGLPVLARDIPVFREIAPPATRFFGGDDGPGLDEAIRAAAAIPRSEAGPAAPHRPPGWQESARQLWQRLQAGPGGQP